MIYFCVCFLFKFVLRDFSKRLLRIDFGKQSKILLEINGLETEKLSKKVRIDNIQNIAICGMKPFQFTYDFTQKDRTLQFSFTKPLNHCFSLQYSLKTLIGKKCQILRNENGGKQDDGEA